MTFVVPRTDGSTSPIALNDPARLTTATVPATSRTAYAAAHVVADARYASTDLARPQIDWEATMGLRRRLWSLGLGVAESMDTSQRGMGLSWQDAMELGTRTLREAKACDGRVVVGIGTDQLPPGPSTLTAIRDAYLEQIELVSAEGGTSVMMASRQLAATAQNADDYLTLYASVLEQTAQPVVLHWLGEMFDPALRGYWGVDGAAKAVDTVAQLLADHADRIDGIKVSVLDADLEIELRRRVPVGVRVYTGDDFHYVDLIAGDGETHSDALLGAFAAIAPFASAALLRLDADDVDGFRKILRPTERLSRLVFAAPTQYYKVGVAWLSYLDGLQDNFRMLAGFETGRPLAHLGELVVEANRIGLFSDPEATSRRAGAYFTVQGIT